MGCRSGSGISEIVASLITLLITIAVGSYIVYMVGSYADIIQSTLRADVESEYLSSVKSLDLVFAVGKVSSNEVSLVIANGLLQSRILSIYINETLAYNYSITINPLEVASLTIKSPINLSKGSIFIAKVIYDGGERVIYGYILKQ